MLKKLLEERKTLIPKMHEMRDNSHKEGRKWTAEDQEGWLKINKRFDEVTGEIDELKRKDDMAASIAKAEQRAKDDAKSDPVGHGDPAGNKPGGPGPTEIEKRTQSSANEARAFRAWCRDYAGQELNEEDVLACRSVGINPHAKQFVVKLGNDRGSFQTLEHRAQSIVSLGGGAALVAETFNNRIEVALLAFGGMRTVAEVLRTSTGAPMPWPTVDDTGNSASRLSENTAAGTTDVTFGQLTLNAYKYSSDFIKVPHELLEDSAINLVGLVGDLIGNRLGRKTNVDYTTGLGIDGPDGMINRAATGVTAASATLIAADELIDLIHSVDPEYRNGAQFMMHDNIAQVIRKLKNGTGDYLWVTSYQDGMADRLLGYGFTVNQSMQSSVAATTKTIAFGLMSKYKIRDIGEVRIIRLDERFADLDQIAFIGLLRTDGGLLDAGTGPVKVLVQAA